MVNPNYLATLLTSYKLPEQKSVLLRTDNHLVSVNLLLVTVLALVLFYFYVMRDELSKLTTTRRGYSSVSKYVPILFLVTSVLCLGFLGYYWYFVNYLYDEYERLHPSGYGLVVPVPTEADSFVTWWTSFFVVVCVLAFLQCLFLFMAVDSVDKMSKLPTVVMVAAALLVGPVPFLVTGTLSLVSLSE